MTNEELFLLLDQILELLDHGHWKTAVVQLQQLRDKTQRLLGAPTKEAP